MSTGLKAQQGGRIKNLNRFAELARMGEVVFHARDLANLWHITNTNTLHTTIKRYVEKGLLFRLHKGFYSIKDPATIDPYLLGIKSLHSYAYVSTESILAEQGIIQQAIPTITLVSNTSKRFSVAGNTYQSRQLDDAFLFQPHGITMRADGVRTASTERAVADLLYFNVHAYFDGATRIDWRLVKKMQQDIGYPLTPKRYE